MNGLLKGELGFQGFVGKFEGPRNLDLLLNIALPSNSLGLGGPAYRYRQHRSRIGHGNA